jgi:hypothetical protein
MSEGHEAWGLDLIEWEQGWTPRNEGYLLFLTNVAAQEWAAANTTGDWICEGPYQVKVDDAVYRWLQQVGGGGGHLQNLSTDVYLPKDPDFLIDMDDVTNDLPERICALASH